MVAQSTLFVYLDAFTPYSTWNETNALMVFNHLPGGSNVLFMDGHFEFLRYSNCVTT